VSVRATLLGLAFLGAVALLAGCGGSSKSSAPPPPPPTTSTATEPPPAPVHIVKKISATVKPGANAKAYTRRVESILSNSSTNLQSLQLYVNQVSTDQLPPDESLVVVRNVLQQGQTDLRNARALTLPPAFKQAQLLLERSLQLRVDQQQEMLVSAKARYDNPLTGWAGSFNRALEVGRQARSVGKQFLTVYAAARKNALGTAPTTLPTSF
jgi:hypothetical protein